ncbi:MAG: NAD(P)-dependent oxidoreductase [Gammaproteobacteria bacterium]
MNEATQLTVGFIGLGNMGRPMATNLARACAGWGAQSALRVQDKAGTAERAPEHAVVCETIAELVAQVDAVSMCLPDGRAGEDVAQTILAAPDSRVRTVADHSTVGIAAAQSLHARFAEGGIEYVDAPVSGGTAGAAKATISLMYAGSAATLERLRPAFAAMAKNVFHVGDRPGQGQTMKLLNNFLSGVAMAATSEAVAFGIGRGLSMGTVLSVLNVSSGQNTASSDKFPNRILTDTYDAGFTSTLLKKDLELYEQALAADDAANPVSVTVIDLWRQLEAAEGTVDFTRIYPFVRDKRYRAA